MEFSKIGSVSPLPRRTMTPSYSSLSTPLSSSTAIKPMPVNRRVQSTPRSANAAAQKTGITPRTVDSAYGSRLSSAVSASSPVSKAVASRIPAGTGPYTVSKTSRFSSAAGSVGSPTGPSSTSSASGPRRMQSLAGTPQRSMRSDGDAVSRLDRELEPYTVDMHSKFKCYASVLVLGADGRHHPATINQIMRSRGSKRLFYGVTFSDGYRPATPSFYVVGFRGDCEVDAVRRSERSRFCARGKREGLCGFPRGLTCSELVGRPRRSEHRGGGAVVADTRESGGNGAGIVENAARIVGEDGDPGEPTQRNAWE